MGLRQGYKLCQIYACPWQNAFQLSSMIEISEILQSWLRLIIKWYIFFFFFSLVSFWLYFFFFFFFSSCQAFSGPMLIDVLLLLHASVYILLDNMPTRTDSLFGTFQLDFSRHRLYTQTRTRASLLTFGNTFFFLSCALLFRQSEQEKFLRRNTNFLPISPIYYYHHDDHYIYVLLVFIFNRYSNFVGIFFRYAILLLLSNIQCLFYRYVECTIVGWRVTRVDYVSSKYSAQTSRFQYTALSANSRIKYHMHQKCILWRK